MTENNNNNPLGRLLRGGGSNRHYYPLLRRRRTNLHLLQQPPSENNVFSLYSVPTFVVRITTPRIDNPSYTNLGREIKKTTEYYLEDFIRASMMNHDDTQKQEQQQWWNSLHGVDLLVSIKQQQDNDAATTTTTTTDDDATNQKKTTTMEVVADMYGTVALGDDPDHPARPTNQQATEFLQTVLDQAFETSSSSSSLEIYKERLQLVASEPLLHNLISVTVQTRVDDDETGAVQATPTSSYNGWSGGEIALLMLTVGFLTVAVVSIALFVRMDKMRKTQKAVQLAEESHNHDKGGDSSHHSFWFAHSRNNHMSGSLASRHLPPWSSIHLQSSNDDDNNGDPNVVPIPGVSSSGSSSGHNTVTPRRYISTATSPFELLYGASYLHADRDKVEREKGIKKNKKSRNKKNKMKNIKPMLSIAEEESAEHHQEEEEDAIMMIDNENGGGGMRTSSWLSQITSYFEPRQQLSQQQGGSSGVSSSQDAPFVYRDFPRHDGTPCLMYNATKNDNSSSLQEGQGHTADAQNSVAMVLASSAQDNATHKTSSTTSSTSMLNAGDVRLQEEGDSGKVYFSTDDSLLLIDDDDDNNNNNEDSSFVDKLERLMSIRQQQYRERIKMDREREAHRRARQAQRELQQQQQQQRQQPDGDDSSVVGATPLSPSVMMPFSTPPATIARNARVVVSSSDDESPLSNDKDGIPSVLPAVVSNEDDDDDDDDKDHSRRSPDAAVLT